MHTAIPLPAAALADYCRRWGIVRLRVFGSVLRDDFGPDSDVDFLVTWRDGSPGGYAALVRAEEELSGLVGRKVDVVSSKALEDSANWLRRRYILEGAQDVFVA